MALRSLIKRMKEKGEDEIKISLDRIRQALSLTMEFLKDEVGIDNAEILPS